MEEKLFKFVQDTIKDITGREGIMYDTDFVKDLGLSSFDIMNLVCIFEEQFDIEIPNRDTLESMLEAEKIAVDQNIKALSVEDALAELKK